MPIENPEKRPPPQNWPALTRDHRKELIKRTDRGVFSLAVQDEINYIEEIQPIAGKVINITGVELGENVEVEIEYANERRKHPFEYVIITIGFSPLSFCSLMDNAVQARVLETQDTFENEKSIHDSKYRSQLLEQFEGKIDCNLALRHVTPRLHLPMLAGLDQGPGFPNLSCLGLLSDRILCGYALPPQAREKSRERCLLQCEQENPN